MSIQNINEIISSETAAYFIARVFLGLLFFFQGYDAVFRIKTKGIIAEIRDPLREKGLPSFLISLGAYFTSYAELVGGFLLVIGFLSHYTLLLLGFDLLIASVAFGLIKPMWDLQFAFPRLVLILFLLLCPFSWNILSLDYFLLTNF